MGPLWILSQLTAAPVLHMLIIEPEEPVPVQSGEQRLPSSMHSLNQPFKHHTEGVGLLCLYTADICLLPYSCSECRGQNL